MGGGKRGGGGGIKNQYDRYAYHKANKQSWVFLEYPDRSDFYINWKIAAMKKSCISLEEAGCWKENQE